MSKFKKKFKKIFYIWLLIPFTPIIAGAVTLKHTLGTVSGIINGIIPILLALAVLAFFWGLVTYLMDVNNPEKKKNGIQIMVMGVVVIFVMVSIWGIVRVLQSTFKVDSSKPIVPEVIERRVQSDGIF